MTDLKANSVRVCNISGVSGGVARAGRGQRSCDSVPRSGNERPRPGGLWSRGGALLQNSSGPLRVSAGVLRHQLVDVGIFFVGFVLRRRPGNTLCIVRNSTNPSDLPPSLRKSVHLLDRNPRIPGSLEGTAYCPTSRHITVMAQSGNNSFVRRP